MIRELSQGIPGARRIGAIFFMAVVPIFDVAFVLMELRQANRDWTPVIFFAVASPIFPLWLLWSSNRLKRVSIDRKYLYVEDQKNSIMIPLDQMKEAHYLPGANRRYGTATITFKTDTVFGREIMFIPQKERRTVDELIDLIVSLQD